MLARVASLLWVWTGPGAGEAGVVGVVGQSMGVTITIASDAGREGGESGGGSGRVGRNEGSGRVGSN